MDREHDMDRELLLAQSGELTPNRQAELDEALASDSALREQRDTLVRLCRDSREPLSADGPSAEVLARIAAEARRRAEHPGIVVFFPTPVVRLAACAAALAIMVGTWAAWPPGRNQEDAVGNLRTILALVSETGVVGEPKSGMAEQERIRALAHELLVLQGLAVEELTLETTPEEEPHPTTLRWRSSPGFRAETRV